MDLNPYWIALIRLFDRTQPLIYFVENTFAIDFPCDLAAAVFYLFSLAKHVVVTP